MRYESPAAAFYARVDGFPTGIAGTVGVQIIDKTGTAVVARTTTGIIESPAGSGSYLASLTAPITPGEYSIFWDQGTISPGTTSGEQLTVTAGAFTINTATGTWTYDPTKLATSELYQVRLEIGDTDSTAPLLADQEINRAISIEPNMWGASAHCCEIISRTYLRKADVRIGRGGTSIQYSKQASQYAEMATALRKRANAMNVPWTGGTSISAKESIGADSDAVQPIFTKTLMNSTFVGDQSNNSPTEEDE